MRSGPDPSRLGTEDGSKSRMYTNVAMVHEGSRGRANPIF